MSFLSVNLDLNRCPHCNVANPNIRTVHQFETNNYLNNRKRLWYVYVCSKCGGAVIAAGQSHNGQTFEIYPSATVIDNAIPNPAYSYLQQAKLFC